jgi:hypothetical protein
VRIQSVTEDDRYETLSVRTTIAVPLDSDVVIPRFGGEVGADLDFDLGAGIAGTCTLTGDFPT